MRSGCERRSAGTHRRRFLRQFSVESLGEALQERVSPRHDHAAVQTLNTHTHTLRTPVVLLLLNIQEPKRSLSHRPDVNVAHADAGGDDVSDAQHGVSRQTLRRAAHAGHSDISAPAATADIFKYFNSTITDMFSAFTLFMTRFTRLHDSSIRL